MPREDLSTAQTASFRVILLFGILLGSSSICRSEDSPFASYIGEYGWTTDAKTFPTAEAAMEVFQSRDREASRRIRAAEHICAMPVECPESCMKSAFLVALCRDDPDEVRVMAIQIIAKGLECAANSLEAESLLYRISRDDGIPSLVRCHAFKLLAFLSRRTYAIVRECHSLLSSHEISDEDASLVIYSIQDNPFKSNGIDNECVANILLSSYDENLPIGRKKMLLHFLSRCQGRTDNLTELTRRDIDKIGLREMTRSENKAGIRYEAFTLVRRNSVGIEIYHNAIDSLVRESEITTRQKELLLKAKEAPAD